MGASHVGSRLRIPERGDNLDGLHDVGVQGTEDRAVGL